MSRLTRGTGLPRPFRENNFSGANGDREIFIFPVQLTTSRTGNLTRLITLAIFVTIQNRMAIQVQLWGRRHDLNEGSLNTCRSNLYPTADGRDASQALQCLLNKDPSDQT